LKTSDLINSDPNPQTHKKLKLKKLRTITIGRPVISTIDRPVFRVNICKKTPILGSGGQQIVSGPFFSDSSNKNGVPGNFQLKRTYFDKKFWTHRSMSTKMTKNDSKKHFSPKVPNLIKLSVKVRIDFYNGFRVFLEKKFFYSFGNLNDHFRACFRPNVKNRTDTLRPSYHIGHFSYVSMTSTIFLQKIREVTHFQIKIYTNFKNCHFCHIKN
jgi:hypothetical protein